MQLFSTSFPLRAVALASMVLLGACSKKSDDPAVTPTTPTTYATTWTADSKNYTASTSTGAVNNGTLIIGATQAVSTTESYSVTLNVPAATGTYTIGGTSASTSAGYSTTIGSAATGYIAASSFGSGTITVTTLSTTEIIGTFSFTAIAPTSLTTTKAVTNGKFAIKR